MEYSPQLLIGEPLTKHDIPICEVRNGAENGLVIYLNTQMDPPTTKSARQKFMQKQSLIQKVKEFKIEEEGIMFPIPKPDGAAHIYIFGPTECGKSVFCSFYAHEYEELYPNNLIYLVSDIAEDPILDKLHNLRRVTFDEIMNGEASPETLPDSLIIFDDVDAIVNKAAGVAVEALRDSLLTKGRHYGISVVCTSHKGLGGPHSRVAINEATAFVFFPKCGGWHHPARVLQEYVGLNHQAIERIHQLPSRWVMVCQRAPNYVLYEKGIYLL